MGSEKPGIDTRDTALLKGSQGFIKHAESSQWTKDRDQSLGTSEVGDQHKSDGRQQQKQIPR